ncbi:hypothetical protein BU15DRAFT_67303 [Melanogaster broomeanus]|nr:hypothetical protein BU15DRAFT_67303 [Melanogaster broomeanus]
MGVSKLLYGHPKPPLGHPQLPPWVSQLLLWASQTSPWISQDLPWVSQSYYMSIPNLHWGIPNSHPGYPNCYCGHPKLLLGYPKAIMWASQTPTLDIPIATVGIPNFSPGCPKICCGCPKDTLWASPIHHFEHPQTPTMAAQNTPSTYPECILRLLLWASQFLLGVIQDSDKSFEAPSSKVNGKPKLSLGVPKYLDIPTFSDNKATETGVTRVPLVIADDGTDLAVVADAPKWQKARHNEEVRRQELAATAPKKSHKHPCVELTDEESPNEDGRDHCPAPTAPPAQQCPQSMATWGPNTGFDPHFKQFPDPLHLGIVQQLIERPDVLPMTRMILLPITKPDTRVVLDVTSQTRKVLLTTSRPDSLNTANPVAYRQHAGGSRDVDAGGDYDDRYSIEGSPSMYDEEGEYY